MTETDDIAEQSIRDTNRYIRKLLQQEIFDTTRWVRGIVAEVYLSDKGHLYFNLKDDNYSIRCIIYSSVRSTIPITVIDHMEVIVYGKIGFYEQAAQAQIEIEKLHRIERPPYVIDPSIRERLRQENLWPLTKRPLSEKINHITVITSLRSEVIHDFKQTYEKEGGTATYDRENVAFYGEQAPHRLAEVIRRINQQRKADVIAIIRGGGSDEDLSIFDDYLVAEAICRSKIPVVTGIRHARNQTLADEVADISEITPTALANFLAQHSKKALQPEIQPSIPTTANRTSNLLLIVLIIIAVLGLLFIIIIASNP